MPRRDAPPRYLPSPQQIAIECAKIREANNAREKEHNPLQPSAKPGLGRTVQNMLSSGVLFGNDHSRVIEELPW